jgi:5-(carboxyamino)imidazole ribonucleotide mutase
MGKVGVVMGSRSDLPVVEKALGVLQSYGVPAQVRVLSAHRCTEEAREFAASARESGFSVLIAAAGMAAHLAGALAANTTLPVIGIPCSSAKLDGMDALLSTVMMPSGIPVATVAVDGAKNAAILAVEILALSDPDLAAKLEAARAEEKWKVLEADREVRTELSTDQT